MKHELTKERVPGNNFTAYRRCSACGGFRLPGEDGCPGPPAAVAPEAQEPDPDEVRRVIEVAREMGGPMLLVRVAELWLREREQPLRDLFAERLPCPAYNPVALHGPALCFHCGKGKDEHEQPQPELPGRKDVLCWCAAEAVALVYGYGPRCNEHARLDLPQPAPAFTIEQVIEACGGEGRRLVIIHENEWVACTQVWVGTGSGGWITKEREVASTPEAAIQALGEQAVTRLREQREQTDAALRKLGQS